jgi:hypothetical protein
MPALPPKAEISPEYSSPSQVAPHDPWSSPPPGSAKATPGPLAHSAAEALAKAARGDVYRGICRWRAVADVFRKTKAISVRSVYQLPAGISVGHNLSLAALCC